MSNLFTPGPPRSSVPCIAQKCTKCCHETQMPLTLGDLERITALDYRIDDFTIPNPDGTLRLRNVEGDACFFLDPSGRCSINNVKPEGCRLYPFIYDEDAKRVIRDDYCPYTKDFAPPPDVEAKVRELVGRLNAESKHRLSLGPSKRF